MENKTINDLDLWLSIFNLLAILFYVYPMTFKIRKIFFFFTTFASNWCKYKYYSSTELPLDPLFKVDISEYNVKLYANTLPHYQLLIFLLLHCHRYSQIVYQYCDLYLILSLKAQGNNTFTEVQTITLISFGSHSEVLGPHKGPGRGSRGSLSIILGHRFHTLSVIKHLKRRKKN